MDSGKSNDVSANWSSTNGNGQELPTCTSSSFSEQLAIREHLQGTLNSLVEFQHNLDVRYRKVGLFYFSLPTADRQPHTDDNNNTKTWAIGFQLRAGSTKSPPLMQHLYTIEEMRVRAQVSLWKLALTDANDFLQASMLGMKQAVPMIEELEGFRGSLSKGAGSGLPETETDEWFAVLNWIVSVPEIRRGMERRWGDEIVATGGVLDQYAMGVEVLNELEGLELRVDVE